MKLYALIQVLWAFNALTLAHEDGSNIGYQEPFVGWTKEDLDAKWGTDVSLMSFKWFEINIQVRAVGILRHLNIRPSATREMSPTSRIRIRHRHPWSTLRHSSNIQAWSAFWTTSHSSRICATNQHAWLQSPRKDESLPGMGQGRRLW